MYFFFKLRKIKHVTGLSKKIKNKKKKHNAFKYNTNDVMACNVTSQNHKTSTTNSFLRVKGSEDGEKRVAVIAWQVNFFIFFFFFWFYFYFSSDFTVYKAIIHHHFMFFSSCSCFFFFLLSLHTISISIFLFINGR